MGPDSVALVIAIEKEFDMGIPDEKTAKLDTVGKFYWYIIENHDVVQEGTQRQDYESEV